MNYFQLSLSLQDIDLKIKWPNDIYSGNVKVGGIGVRSIAESSMTICNIGKYRKTFYQFSNQNQPAMKNTF